MLRVFFFFIEFVDIMLWNMDDQTLAKLWDYLNTFGGCFTTEWAKILLAESRCLLLLEYEWIYKYNKCEWWDWTIHQM